MPRGGRQASGGRMNSGALGEDSLSTGRVSPRSQSPFAQPPHEEATQAVAGFSGAALAYSAGGEAQDPSRVDGGAQAGGVEHLSDASGPTEPMRTDDA